MRRLSNRMVRYGRSTIFTISVLCRVIQVIHHQGLVAKAVLCTGSVITFTYKDRMRQGKSLVYFVLLLGMTAKAQDDFADMLNQGQPCPPFRCSKGFSPVPPKKLKLESTGCSGMSAGVMVSMPGANDQKLSYESCCHEWHACYRTCASPKLVCDETFSQCSEALCDDEECKRSMGLQKMMININACRTYDELQAKACECVETSVAAKRRESAVQYFYEKYVPEVDDAATKAKQLVQKVDTSVKLAGLFRKLVKKYPASVAQVEDPAKSKYEDMVKKAQAENKQKEAEVEEEEDDTDEKIEL